MYEYMFVLMINILYTAILLVCLYHSLFHLWTAPEILNLCQISDIVFLQETWLLDSELDVLNSLSNEYYSKGISAVNTKDKILTGRPHGGIAVLWKKTLQTCEVVVVDECVLIF